MKKSLIARKTEISIFKKIEVNSKSDFIAVYGRRRIGKTYLINEYFKKNSFYFSFTGTKNLPAKLQIKNYIQELNETFNLKISSTPTNWTDAFQILRQTVVDLQKNDKSKKVIFFDELPFLASKKSGFIEALDYLWNSFLVKRNDIILVVCGSSANWMISEIVNNKGGLHNRITSAPIAMSPFTLKETQDYIKSKGMDFNLATIAEIYMVTGGVAYYLDQINQGESSAQFINNSFFSEQGLLRREFDRLFQSLFDNCEVHIKIIRILASKPSGMTYSELAKASEVIPGGTFTKILSELEKSDFIHFNQKMGNTKREGVYRLIDEYTLFYLTWVENLGKSFKDNYYWQKQVNKPRYNTWLGFAFESLCFKHSDKIIAALGISGLTTHVYGFRNNKVQIDMIIDRADKAMNLCEIKYAGQPYEMTAIEAKKIQQRKFELHANHSKSKQIFVTLITTQPAKRNKHYLSVVDNEINLEDFFG